MTDEEKLDEVYRMCLKLDAALPNLVTKLGCLETHGTLVKRVDRIYIVVAAISGTFSFLGVVIGFYLKAKGVL